MWALFPLMLVFMVLTMAYKISSKALEPEVLREISPIAEQAALAKAGGKYLLPGGS